MKTKQPTVSTATDQEIRDAYAGIQSKLHPIPCRLCTTIFTPKRHWQLFCCGSHRVIYFRLRKELTNAKANSHNVDLDRELGLFGSD
jgi:hypothetical protein